MPSAFQSHNGAIAAQCLVLGTSVHSKVSIPQWCDCCRNEILRAFHSAFRFNPTMVRLLLHDAWRLKPKVFGRFNPTMVRLLRRKCRLLVYGSYSFNPTMVRLLLSDRYPSAGVGNLFQSHNGAIAAVSKPLSNRIQAQFQSHNGAIAAETRSSSAF